MMAINVKLALLLVSVTALGLPWFAHGYATGAPKEVCEDMLPQHGAPAQTKESPYTLTSNRKSVKGGETVTLTLAAKDQSKFKGFLVQARNSKGVPIGSFTPLPPSKSGDEFKGKWKLITCPKGPTNNTATHVNSIEKTRVVLTWIAPKDLDQSFNFKYTVVKNGGEYWVRKETETISVTASNPSVAAKKN